MTDFLADPRHDLSCSSVPPRPDLEAASHLDVRSVGRLRSPGANELSYLTEIEMRNTATFLAVVLLTLTMPSGI